MATRESTKTLVIVHNDVPDADNIAMFLCLFVWAGARPDIELVFLFEPRPVDFGLKPLKPSEQKPLDGLLRKHFPSHGNPLKIRLNGLLKEEDVEQLEGVDKEDKDLLRKAISTTSGSLEDSILHAELMAWDLAKCLGELCGVSGYQNRTDIQIYTCQPHLETPVNLNCHASEHLFTRTTKDIEAFYNSIDPLEVKRWYEDRIQEAKSVWKDRGVSVGRFDLDSLSEKIMTADHVTFVEGASFQVLRSIVEHPTLAEKINCLVQAGTKDLANNIFDNQFNIALHEGSARYVLERTDAFKDFVAVPSHTSQAISFLVDGLEHQGFSSLAKWILSFNFREDPVEVSKRSVSLARDHPGQTVKLPDLAMILLAFREETFPRDVARVVLEQRGRTLLFKPSDALSKGIKIWEPREGHEYEQVELVDVLTSRF